MASWVDLSALHNPAPGLTPPASWGDGIQNDLDIATSRNFEALNDGNSGTTTSTSYTDLSGASVGPAVSLDTGTSAVVFMQAIAKNSNAGLYVAISCAVSGASSIAASDPAAVYFQQPIANQEMVLSGFTIITGLTPGTNTFTLKYRVNGNTGTYLGRRLFVVPLF